MRKKNSQLPFPILKSLSEQARRIEEESSGCKGNIRLFGVPIKNSNQSV